MQRSSRLNFRLLQQMLVGSLLLIGGGNGIVMGTERYRTDIPNLPSDRYAHFQITSEKTPDELVAILRGLIETSEALKVKRLRCHEYGETRKSLSCFALAREDVFKVHFDSDTSIVTVSLVVRIPANQDRSYKPDYKSFEEIDAEIQKILLGYFGQTRVTPLK